MAQLNVKIEERQLLALRQYAARRRTPVSWLVKDYVAYLLAGGQPVVAPDELTPAELSAIAQASGALRWLEDEPDLYSLDDGEEV